MVLVQLIEEAVEAGLVEVLPESVYDTISQVQTPSVYCALYCPSLASCAASFDSARAVAHNLQTSGNRCRLHMLTKCKNADALTVFMLGSLMFLQGESALEHFTAEDTEREMFPAWNLPIVH